WVEGGAWRVKGKLVVFSPHSPRATLHPECVRALEPSPFRHPARAPPVGARRILCVATGTVAAWNRRSARVSSGGGALPPAARLAAAFWLRANDPARSFLGRDDALSGATREGDGRRRSRGPRAGRGTSIHGRAAQVSRTLCRLEHRIIAVAAR